MENLDDAEKKENADSENPTDSVDEEEIDDVSEKEDGPQKQADSRSNDVPSNSLDFLTIFPLEFPNTPQRNKELQRFCDILRAPFVNVPLLVAEHQEDILPLLSLYIRTEENKGKRASFYSVTSSSLKDDDDDSYDISKMNMASTIVMYQKKVSDIPVYSGLSDYADHDMLDKFTRNFLNIGMPAVLYVNKKELENVRSIVRHDKQISGGIENPLAPYDTYGFARTKEIEIAPMTRKEKQIYFFHYITDMLMDNGFKQPSGDDCYYFINQVLDRFSDQDIFFKAFDLMNRVTVKAQKRHRRSISKQIIDEVLQEYAPLHNRTEALMDLDTRLKGKIYGQDQAVETCYETILADLDDDNRTKPTVLGFFGPSGVGKTALAEEISLALTGKKVSTINMGEYSDGFKVSILTGSSKGYVNSDEDGLLAKIIKENPRAVILLDEFEKADPEVQQMFLGIFDKGSLYDNHSGQIDMAQSTIILTSNAGIRPNTTLGFGCSRTTEYVADQDLIQRVFPPELLGRLDAKILFNPLSKEALEKIVDKFMNQLKPRFDKLGVGVSLSPEAKRELIEKAKDPSAGARPILSLIRQKIKTPIEIAVLKGRVKKGQHIVVQSISKKEMNVVSKHRRTSSKSGPCRQNIKS
ncbi:MAG: ATP-dependent Clp protease ATP-binding subunit [Alphaproteobacteria bacterium]|nr:ATP-dependent Clp protease ATP-binding subunit [Alphaproteobacteria bacterium]